MQGHPEVIDYLNTLLTGELAARDQYFVHSRMYEDWGFSKLYERINHEMEEEAQHADALMRRILMLEGTPRMRRTTSTSAPQCLRCSPAICVSNTRYVLPCARVSSSVSCTATT